MRGAPSHRGFDLPGLKMADRKGVNEMIKVCENEIKCCPYCGSKKINELSRKLAAPNCHAVFCERCNGVFFIPCED